MKIKKYISQSRAVIDYLFWKRTWFRALFILIPTIAIMLGFNHFFDKTIMTIYFALFFLAIYDNKHIDKPKNPFK